MSSVENGFKYMLYLLGKEVTCGGLGRQDWVFLQLQLLCYGIQVMMQVQIIKQSFTGRVTIFAYQQVNIFLCHIWWSWETAVKLQKENNI